MNDGDDLEVIGKAEGGKCCWGDFKLRSDSATDSVMKYHLQDLVRTNGECFSVIRKEFLIACFLQETEEFCRLRVYVPRQNHLHRVPRPRSPSDPTLFHVFSCNISQKHAAVSICREKCCFCMFWPEIRPILALRAVIDVMTHCPFRGLSPPRMVDGTDIAACIPRHGT